VNAIVYVNSSHERMRYVNEAAKSAASFRAYYPDARIMLFTDAVGYSHTAFDEIHQVDFALPRRLVNTAHKNGQMVAKLAALSTVDADRVMYLGSDTYALKPEAGSLFRLLDGFDIAAAHAPLRINTLIGNSPLPQVPPCFPEFNCDLVLWRRHEGTIELLRRWEQLYMSHELGHPHDQGPFRLLVYESNLRVATLPPEYNYRGPEVRADTVILQRRELLDAYLAESGPAASGARGRWRAPMETGVPWVLPVARTINRGLRRMGMEVRRTSSTSR
jgi:hypothetical protein